ncbi:hypothetical protein J4434_06415 [Candidatus Woesearchaeota archaeon]|nr:hypothetical protein [Candidatus Woesearchaeota archaeon]
MCGIIGIVSRKEVSVNNNLLKCLKRLEYRGGVENPGNGRKIYILRQNVVEAQLKDKPAELIARACYLNIIRDFGADGRYFGGYDSAVRGVWSEPLEVDT